jgi:hypothetical protein
MKELEANQASIKMPLGSIDRYISEKYFPLTQKRVDGVYQDQRN